MTTPLRYRTFAQVALALPAAPYTYGVPPELEAQVDVGTVVKVPLGKRAEIGCVVALRDDPQEVPPEKIRGILKIVSAESRVSDESLQLARFISSYYFCSLGEALATVSSVSFREQAASAPVLYRVESARSPSDAKLTKRQREVVEALDGHPPATRAALARAAGCSPGLLDKIAELGVLVEAEDAKTFSPRAGTEHFAPFLEPTPPQRDALARILPAIREPRFETFLLYGVTGSGKTEVYLQAMTEALSAGGTVLCLVPEISLTPQTVERFQERFREPIGVFHSKQSQGAKRELHRRIAASAIRIVIGARSALFSPLPNLRLIVVDEEHDPSYKQRETPRYHARDTALVRAQRLGIPVILGSATPSLETFHNAKTGKYTLLPLPGRAGGGGLPPVRPIDLTREISESGNPGLFSLDLVTAIRKRLAAKEQVLLFLNRRGFSNFLFCPSCKWVARCSEDDVAMTVHRRKGSIVRGGTEEPDLFTSTGFPAEGYALHCHFCGARHDPPKVCPECGADDLMAVGTGTQRVEEEIARLFPEARLLRMDQDTVRGKSAYADAYERMVRGDVDIILGTQMIAKGLHLERVTLVGVVLADVGLFLPDFRAEERTFTILTQVAGRAGRVGKGEVLLQTYMPNHFAIRHACTHDYEGFFAEESQRRSRWDLPPYQRLVALTLSHSDRSTVWNAARSLAWSLQRGRNAGPRRRMPVRVNGPTIAPLGRLAGAWRFRILLRCERMQPMADLLRGVLADKDLALPSTVRLTIDVDPADLM